MSAPIYNLPPSYVTTESSSWIWVIVIIILIIVIIALVIWLIVRHTQNDNNGRLVTIQGAGIRSSSSSITGLWGVLTDETDTVTLYVSTKPIVFGDNGVVVCNSGTCQQASGTGSTNSVTITNLTINTTYNAVLVATNSNTTSYAIYGPVKVYTQETAQLANILFNIKDLNSTGAVSSSGTYTETSGNIGIYRYGPAVSNTSPSKSFLVKYDNDTDATNLILCRLSTENNPFNNSVVLAEWTNSDSPTAQAEISYKGTNILPSNCEWSYNDDPPPDADGRNAWCLTTQQQTLPNNPNFVETLCMARNGTNLTMVTPTQATTWFNSQVANSPVL